MSNSTLFGHPIHFLNGEWVFSDDLSPTVATHNTRSCGVCKKFRQSDGHDPCIRNLPNTLNACCGHGNVDECYIMLHDGTCFYGTDAVHIILDKIIEKGGK